MKRYKKIIKKQIDEGFRDITTLGSLPFISSTILILILINFKSALIIFIGLILIEAIGALIKIIFYKKRPNHQSYSNIIEKIDSGSFPSIHSARSILIALAISLLLSSGIIVGFMFLCVFLVGVSRVYLKKHFIVDIIGGYIFGFLSWYITNMFINWLIV